MDTHSTNVSAFNPDTVDTYQVSTAIKHKQIYCDTATYVFFFLSPKMAAENGQVRTVDLAPFLEDATSAASAAACAAVAHSLLETGLVVLHDPRVDECGL